MTNEQWAQAHKDAEKLYETSKNPGSDDWFMVVDDYYSNYVLKRQTATQNLMKAKVAELMDSVV